MLPSHLLFGKRTLLPLSWYYEARKVVLAFPCEIYRSRYGRAADSHATVLLQQAVRFHSMERVPNVTGTPPVGDVQRSQLRDAIMHL